MYIYTYVRNVSQSSKHLHNLHLYLYFHSKSSELNNKSNSSGVKYT